MNVALVIEAIKKYRGISTDRELADELGISPQNLSAWKSRDSLDENKIVDKFPELNLAWVMTGEGEMLKKDAVVQNNQHQVGTTIANSINYHQATALDKALAVLAENQAMLTTSQSQMTALINQLSAKDDQLKAQSEQITLLINQIANKQ